MTPPSSPVPLQEARGLAMETTMRMKRRLRGIMPRDTFRQLGRLGKKGRFNDWCNYVESKLASWGW